MGCDIHMYVEKKNDKGVWKSIDYFVPSDSTDYPDEGHWTRIPVDENRSYWLFGILAGVRNWDVEPISSPRGLPDDICDYVRKEAKSWGGDAHSHSYLTLRELIEYEGSHPKLMFSNLNTLIGKLKQRCDDLYYIYDFDWDSAIKGVPENAMKKAENIRIVFWFDN